MGKLIKNGVEYGGVKLPKLDTELSASSTNPVQNKVIKEAVDAVDAKVTALTSRLDNIIDGNEVSF